MLKVFQSSLVLFVTFTFVYVTSLTFKELRTLHDARLFTNGEIGKIASLYNETYFREALSHILIPRVVGSEGHRSVREYIIGELSKLDWYVEEDRFQADTPIFGPLQFSNVIAKLNPNANRYLALACHYDSKYMPPRFDAATDSAVPCTMMLQIAKSLGPILSTIRDSDLSLKLIFFDGEEAFKEWSAHDSLYGSRNLAEKWQATPLRTNTDPAPSNVLDSIDVLVLLDLLGAKDPKFYSFFPETQRWHLLLASIERKLKSQGLIPANQPLHFLEKSTISSVEDDHIPFMIRGVPILHLIPLPFPHVWHTPNDDFSVLHFPTISTLNKIIQVFTLSYLDGSIASLNKQGYRTAGVLVLLVLLIILFLLWRLGYINWYYNKESKPYKRDVSRNYQYSKLKQKTNKREM